MVSNYISNSNPKVFFGGVTYNQFLAVLRRPCLSFRKEKNKLKMRRFWKNVRKLKGKTEKLLFLFDSLCTLRFFVLTNSETKSAENGQTVALGGVCISLNSQKRSKHFSFIVFCVGNITLTQGFF